MLQPVSKFMSAKVLSCTALTSLWTKMVQIRFSQNVVLQKQHFVLQKLNMKEQTVGPGCISIQTDCHGVMDENRLC